MAEATKITIHYAEKRTANYQSAEFSMSVEVALEPDDNIDDEREGWSKWLTAQVTHKTDTEIRRLAAESRNSK